MLVEVDMKRRTLLATVPTASIAGCLGTPTKTSNADSPAKIDLNEYTWKHEIPGANMTISEGRVFGQEVRPNSTQEESELDISGGVFSLDVESGDHQWTYGSSVEGMSGFQTPIVTDAVYVNKVNDVATWSIAIEFDGTERWAGSEHSSETEDVFNGAILDATYGIAYLSGINAVNSTGDVLWSYPGTSIQFDTSSPEHPETAYSAGNEVVALNTADGSEEWRYEHGSGRSVVHAVSDDIAYVTVDRESIAAVADGKAIWRQDSPSGMTILGLESGALLARDGSQVYAFDALSGEKQWDQEIAGNIYIMNDRIYAAKTGFAGKSSTVSAFRLDDGTEDWSIGVGDKDQYEHLSLEVIGEKRPKEKHSLFTQIGKRKLHRINSRGEITQTVEPKEELHDFTIDEYLLISTDSGIYAFDR